MATKEEKVFHKSAGYASEIGRAPTPFQIIGKGVKNVAKSVGRVATKVATAITTPTVRVMKKHDAKMEKMNRKAKAGEFN